MAQIHPTAVIDSTAQVADDAVIGPWCVVGPKATIGARTILRSHVVIESHTKLGADNVLYPFSTVGGTRIVPARPWRRGAVGWRCAVVRRN